MDFNKKEMPIQGFAGFGGGATSAAFRSSGLSSKYVEDVFYINTWVGTGSEKEIDNGVNMSSEGGMVWVKNRDENDNNWLFQNVIGTGWAQKTNGNSQRFGAGPNYMTSFDDDGFTVGNHVSTNGTDDEMIAWTFRNSKAFQCMTYAGNGSNRTISHDLGSVPGLIFIKAYDSTENWRVYHKTLGPEKHLILNLTNASADSATQFNDTAPTASVFSVGTDDAVNEDGKNFLAYLFAGGVEQGNASVDIDGQNGHYMEWEASSDWVFDGQFCIEYWVYMNANGSEEQILSWGTGAYRAIFWTGSTWKLEWPTGNSNFDLGGSAPTGTWKHHVLTRDGSNVIRFFIDGVMQSNQSTSDDIGENSKFVIGIKYNYPGGGLQGKISNVRIVKGSIPTTYQTSSTTNSATIFTSPTSPLSTTSQGATASDVKLLCCNDTGASGFTVAPGPVILKGTPRGNITSSPFAAATATDAGAVFGEDEDKPIMKCGSYIGNGSATGNHVDIGFEPQYVMIKRYDTTDPWFVYDSLRGIQSGSSIITGYDQELRPDSSTKEYTYSRLDLTSTGFIPMTDNQYTNEDGSDYVYFCIRRPDGYVGKPPTAGTDVFTMDSSGTGANIIPAYDSGFTVDFTLEKNPTGTSWGWFVSSRLTGDSFLATQNTDNEQSGLGDYVWDSNVGCIKGTWTTPFMAWMWKRHAGFDVVTYKPSGDAGYTFAHSLGRTPEMIWIKDRDTDSRSWFVYHKGLNGGSSPEDYYIKIGDVTEANYSDAWEDTAPTSRLVTLGNDSSVNNSSDNYVAMLFASISGISKVGVYAGSNSAQSITTGFQPRFVIIKNTANTDPWYVLDTTRGWASGDDKRLYLNESVAQSDQDVGAPTSTGFDLTANVRAFNQSGRYYIYYAHA